jgi:aspartate/methionine/tyrosine aminotransferase
MGYRSMSGPSASAENIGAPKPDASRRGARIAPFIVMNVLAEANRLAATGRRILHLEVGEPAGGPPAQALEAAAAALRSAPLGYTEALGLPALRERLSRHYRDWYGLDVPAERIAITPGASGGFILAFLAAFDAGARVAAAEPGYPAYRNILDALDIEAIALPTEAATRFQPDLALLEREPPPEGLIIASPANPTGSMLQPGELARIGAWCRANAVRLVADEIYHGITYDRPASSVLATAPEAIVVNSFSKFFCMTGWRLGWLVLPPDLVDPVTRLAQNLFISAPTLSQHAALGAFEAVGELSARVTSYRENRDRLQTALATVGLTPAAPPDGAFYLYLDISRFSPDSAALAGRILAETGVAVTPGLDFDRTRGRSFIRLSFASDKAVIDEAAERLTAWFAANG